MAIVFPAATVVLVREGHQGLETLLLKRADTLDFGGGAWVFPGGRIDRADYPRDSLDVEVAAKRAAVREAMEEASVCISPEDLVCFAHWLTPDTSPKRFATWFYIAEYPEDTGVIAIDDGEIVDYQWCKPSEALKAYHSNQLSLMYPTKMTLMELADCEDVNHCIHRFRERPQSVKLPKVTHVESTTAILYPEDHSYESGVLTTHGNRDRILIENFQWRAEKS